MSSENIQAAIFDFIYEYADESYSFSVDEIYEYHQGQFEKKDIVSALDQFVAAGDVERDGNGSGARYRMKRYAESVEFDEQIEEHVKRRSDLWIEDENYRMEASHRILNQISQKSVMRTLAESYTEEESFATAVRDIAVQIAEEDPIDLLIEMVKWVRDDINNLADQLYIDSANNPSQVSKITREIGFRVKKAERLFQRLFRLDNSDMLIIPNVTGMQLRGRRVSVDIDRVKSRLETRVFGDRFIEVIDVPENTHDAAVGTDASIGDIFISHASGSFIPAVPGSLFISGASMRFRLTDNDGSPQNYWDFDIEPRGMETYAELQAAENGLFISPNLKAEVISDFQHLSVAAMELRQYDEELRIIHNNAQWTPMGNVPALNIPPKPSIIFRDGRIFPLVHRIEDYEGASAPDDVLYGTIVRKEIDKFYEVLHNTVGRGRSGITYSGAVKAPAFSWLSMIVFWYLYKTTGEEIYRDRFYRPPLNDQAVCHLLFWGICLGDRELINPNKRFALVTFRTVRRFSDIAFQAHPVIYRDLEGKKYYVDEDSEDDWYKYFEYHINEVDRNHDENRRGVGSLGDVKKYAEFIDLCKQAAVVMFYGTPCRLYTGPVNDGGHLLMPRWEVAVDVSKKSIEKDSESRILDLLMWICDPDGLEIDGKHAVGGHQEVSRSLPLFIPDVVAQAHDAVTFSRDEQKHEVTKIIFDLIQLIRDSKRGI